MIINDGTFNGRRILSLDAIKELQANQVGRATVEKEEYVNKARNTDRKDIYGLGEWREELNENGEAVFISSPGWAGVYPWIDRRNNVYGFFLAGISSMKNGFSPFYTSPVLPMIVRKILND